jgi:hypothetical protein
MIVMLFEHARNEHSEFPEDDLPFVGIYFIHSK